MRYERVGCEEAMKSRSSGCLLCLYGSLRRRQGTCMGGMDMGRDLQKNERTSLVYISPYLYCQLVCWASS